MKIKIPDGMLKAALADINPRAHGDAVDALEAALVWQRGDVQPKLDALLRRYLSDDPHDISGMRNGILNLLCERESEVPEEIKDLMCAGAGTVKEAYFRPDIYNQRIIDAFNRGKKAGK